MEKKEKGIIENIKDEVEVIKGNKTKDKIYSTKKTFDSELEAKQAFDEAKRRLFDVNRWSDIPGAANAAFTIHSEDGKKISRTEVALNEYIEIDLPGPLPMFWVKVISIDVRENQAEFMVQPAHDPRNKSDPEKVDHFFIGEARSIFRVVRNGNTLEGYEIGLNEGVNNEGDQAGNQALLNTLVSAGGWAAFQKYQWKNLTAYLVGELTIEQS